MSIGTTPFPNTFFKIQRYDYDSHHILFLFDKLIFVITRTKKCKMFCTARIGTAAASSIKIKRKLLQIFDYKQKMLNLQIFRYR